MARGISYYKRSICVHNIPYHSSLYHARVPYDKISWYSMPCRTCQSISSKDAEESLHENPSHSLLRWEVGNRVALRPSPQAKPKPPARLKPPLRTAPLACPGDEKKNKKQKKMWLWTKLHNGYKRKLLYKVSNETVQHAADTFAVPQRDHFRLFRIVFLFLFQFNLVFSGNSCCVFSLGKRTH